MLKKSDVGMPVSIKRTNPGWLKRLTKSMESQEQLAVGIPVNSEGSSAKYEDGTSILLVATVNNFGSPSRNIPARPFISLSSEPMIEKTAPIAESLIPVLNQGKASIADILQQMGPPAVDVMQQTINDLKEPPNAASTIIKKKGSANPLVNTKLLVQSINFAVRKPK
ncbi:hypothetical protein F9L16_23650 [Agarivorans sp. B2Z047]|uniref:hypothetical protein n=1 Tax=Agarivorans sp. B2Z047 TaxID=2652721 RepID=UPI00128C69D8|nr:hypothetical protein [Agarivorans sp. B2Z047]MPW31953.1 hypothetical protein [Agarivorans sp. B2Z047]UQN41882.1 hypothetical protein LQZ07_19200 [Agarivorans sp. B2Z047]UQN44885.1 hypothetical protein LQZ07_10595 [Agarivorans sp. B2Z047]